MSTRKATAHPIDPEMIPAEMRQLDRWVCWRLITRKGGKPTKVPFQAASPKKAADSTAPKTWSGFDVAMAAYRDPTNKLDGIGFVFAQEGPYAGVDFDNCLGPDGSILPWAKPYLDRLIGYAEVSPSGQGVKVFVQGEVPGGKGRKKPKCGPGDLGAIEVYDRGRFFTVTSRRLDDAHAEVGDGGAALADLHAEWFPPEAKPPKARRPAALTKSDREVIDQIQRSKQGPKFSALWNGSTEGHKSGSEADLALCSMLAWWVGGDVGAVDRLFRQSGLYQAEGRAEKWDRITYREPTLDRACTQSSFYDPAYRSRDRGDGQVAPAARQREGPDDDRPGEELPDRPNIEITPQWHVVRDQALLALTSHPELYQRGGDLVEVVAEEGDFEQLSPRIRLKGLAGSPKIYILSEANIGCELTRVATFFRWKKDRDGEDVAVETGPPAQLVRAVTTTKKRPGMRILEGVAECPFPRYDGSIVEAPGYDADTRTFLAPAIEFPRVPDNPTHDDAIAAWGRLAYWVSDFPFATDDDRVVYLAGLLSIVARPAIDGAVPGIAVIGNKAGTGKGYLIDAMTIPGTGRICPTSTYPETTEEASKVKATIALAGKIAVHFDNLREGGSYGGATDSLLTTVTSEERLLCTNNAPELLVRAAFFLSGNNIAPAKDAHRRWLVCRLVTNLEKPEQRKDMKERHLRSAMIARRGEIVRDALTILRAHAVAGRPSPDWSAYGSFDEWDEVVRGAVWFATGRDCLTSQEAANADAPERLHKLALVEGIWELSEARAGRRGLTASAIVSVVETNPSCYDMLRSALLSRGRNGQLATGSQLGNCLKAIQNTPIGGFKLVAHPTKQHHATAWIVERYDQSEGESGESGEALLSVHVRKSGSVEDAIRFAINAKRVLRGPTSASPDSPDSPSIGQLDEEVVECF